MAGERRASKAVAKKAAKRAAKKAKTQATAAPERKVTRQSEHRFLGRAGRGEGTTIFVDDPAVLKALTDPLRHRIVGTLNEPMSAKEVAAALDMPATRLYYHLDLLVERGLAKVADHRTVGRNVERLFVRAGDRFVISEELSRLAVVASDAMGELQRGVNKHIANMLALTRRESEAPDASSDAVGAVMDIGLRLSGKRAQTFVDRMHEVIAEFESDAGGDTEETEKYGLLVMLAPKAGDENADNDTKRSTR